MKKKSGVTCQVSHVTYRVTLVTYLLAHVTNTNSHSQIWGYRLFDYMLFDFCMTTLIGAAPISPSITTTNSLYYKTKWIAITKTRKQNKKWIFV